MGKSWNIQHNDNGQTEWKKHSRQLVRHLNKQECDRVFQRNLEDYVTWKKGDIRKTNVWRSPDDGYPRVSPPHKEDNVIITYGGNSTMDIFIPYGKTRSRKQRKQSHVVHNSAV